MAHEPRVAGGCWSGAPSRASRQVDAGWSRIVGLRRAHGLNRINPPIRVIALVGKRADDVSIELQEGILSVMNGSIMTYDELIDEANGRYRDYLGGLRKCRD